MPSINSPTPDATTVSKGKVQLAGDLAGTAAAPIVNSQTVQRQNNTTNNSVTGTRIETGWGTITGTGATTTSESVSFSAAFTSVPIIMIAPAGGANSAGASYPDTVDAFGDNLNAVTTLQTTTGFKAWLNRAGGSTISSSQSVFYTWIAIGK